MRQFAEGIAHDPALFIKPVLPGTAGYECVPAPGLVGGQLFAQLIQHISTMRVFDQVVHLQRISAPVI